MFACRSGACRSGLRSAVWLALMLLVAGPAAVAQHSISVPATNSALASPSQSNRVIVVGFLGGFVRRDDPDHPEVRLVRELRQQYPTGAYIALFENSHLQEAYRSIVRELNVGDGKHGSSSAPASPRVILFGHSWGASAVVQLARKLNRAAIPVALTIQVDSVAKPFSNDSVIPANVSEAVNFYQTHGLLKGRSRIVAADAERTRILGNVRREYRKEPAACRNFSWYSRTFTRGHIAIECDPDLWRDIKAMLELYLPAEAASPARLEALKPCTNSPGAELEAVDRREDVHSNPIGTDTTDRRRCD
jgi:pimeloyl-ACP methyl ester carboxylesterase